jgi:hypothetical protein
VNVVDITEEEAEFQLKIFPEMYDKVGGPVVCAAAAKAHQLGINPGGEVMATEMPPGVVPEDMKNRLLSQADLEHSGLVEKKNAQPCDHEDDRRGTERPAGDLPPEPHPDETGREPWG